MNQNNLTDEDQTNNQLERNDIQVSPKTVAYLDNMAAQAAELFERATMYKQKHMNAKTNFAKTLYGNKLRKTTNKLDNIMKLFAAIQPKSEGAAE